MKLQGLAIIFIVIMLPIAIVLEEYTKNQAYIVKLQAEYDSKLNNATFDAVKVFQMNTINSDTSDLANSRMRDIAAAANSFYNSLSSNFNMEGYKQDVLTSYVPAVVFTMYDGYYVYGPYTNEITSIYEDENLSASEIDSLKDSKYYDEQQLDGLKPYVYYSTRFVNGSIDVVITFSLDNYVTIDGVVDNKAVKLEGYIIDGIANTSSKDTYTYTVGGQVTTIGLEDLGIEKLPVEGGETKEYECIRQNGVTYYREKNNSSTTNYNEWFSLLNGEKYIMDAGTLLEGMMIEDGVVYQNGAYYEKDDNGWRINGSSAYMEDQGSVTVSKQLNNAINRDTSALQYYADAYEFKATLNSLRLTNLLVSDCQDERVKELLDTRMKIFDYRSSTTEKNIEDFGSNFNMVREAVIRSSIETNLASAIANYNNNFSTGTDFEMPNLTETEWQTLTTDVTVISFLQGIYIGGKVYNGHSIVPNTKTEEVVTESSIYINDEYNNIYYKPTDVNVPDSSSNLRGIFNTTVERRNILKSDSSLMYYYPVDSQAAYTSIVGSRGTYSLDETQTIHDYFRDGGSPNLATVYYRALR